MRSHARGYDGILFDFDGVLADTEPLHWRCWRTLLEPYGILLDWSHYRRSCVGLSNRTMIEELAMRAPRPVDVRELLALNPRKGEMFDEMAASSPVISESTINCILAMSDYKKAVVSSSAGKEVRSTLLRAGILNCFDVVICSEDVSAHKPAPEPYLRAAASLSARRPLVVEDTEIGAQSGRAAGFHVLMISDPQELSSALQARLRLRE